MEQGNVLKYVYLWGHERKAGRKQGLKIRRVCLLHRTEEMLYLFPITSQLPLPVVGSPKTRTYIEIPPQEARAVGLREISYLVLDDVNVCPSNELYDFEGIAPEGSFSKPFMKQAITLARECLKSGNAEVTDR